jgi:hypothetical protein
MVETHSTTPVGPLFELSCRYARAADRRDPVGFAEVFTADGRLSVCSGLDPDEVVRTVSGSDELATIPKSLERFDRTFHFLGQATYEIDDRTASGEIYCIAHHLTVGSAGAENKVMYIRYADEYRFEAGGEWRIAHRRVRWDWTETRVADVPATRY